MTTKREIPLPGDTLAWVHSEISEIKSRLALVAQAADQSRVVASNAADTTNQLRGFLGQFEGIGPALQHLQDDVRGLRDLIARTQEDINSLRQSREDLERRGQMEAERLRQEKNDVARRFAEIERAVETWHERLTGAEEHSRRNLEMFSQLGMRIEAVENAIGDADTSQTRIIATISRIDQELQRIPGPILALQSEDQTQRERINSIAEMLRRLEAEVELMRVETNKISRIDDRVELVQAERTRHNERLNEVAAELHKIDTRLNDHDERSSLIEARISGYQDELHRLRDRIQSDRESLAAYLNGLRELEADMRKRAIVGLEKEIRDIRGRAFDVAPE